MKPLTHKFDSRGFLMEAGECAPIAMGISARSSSKTMVFFSSHYSELDW